MWSDNETTEDLLGFRVHAGLIHSIVTNPKMLPVTIGIFGDWGSGKTSVMRMLEESFACDNHGGNSEKQAKDERVACLYFNGWLFEGYDDAKSAILSSILLQLGEHVRIGPKIRDGVVSLLKSVDYMRLVKLGLQTGPMLAALISGGEIPIPNLVSTVDLFNNKEGEGSESVESQEAATDEKNEEEKTDLKDLIVANKAAVAPLEMRLFRDQFSKLVAKCDIDTLVVLIDDLDRCSPERIIDNLEAIKLFLNVEQTAFVIGADPRIVRHAIATRYNSKEIQEQDGLEIGGDRLVLDYLEKLIQIPYHLPRLSPTEVESYMVLLFCLRDLEEEDAKKCLDAFDSLRALDRYSVFGYANVREALEGQKVPESLFQSLAFCATSAPLITEGLKGNPRQVKRFLNAFTLRKQLAEVAKIEHIHDEVLVKLMVLEYGHPIEYRQLYEWQTVGEGFPKQIQDLESIILFSNKDTDSEKIPKKEKDIPEIPTGWNTPFMQNWIEMEPSLSNVDLRDYYWISRDKLQSEFSGISMAPPIVRRILEGLISSNSGKHNAAVEGAVDLLQDDRSSLLVLLEEHAHRHPDQKPGYDALQALIEKDIEEAVDILIRVLDRCPVRSIPATVGLTLIQLAERNSELEKILQPTIYRLAGTKSGIGVMLKNNNVGI